MMFVKTDGKILYFCGKKCEKSQLKLKRKGTAVKWTGYARAEKLAKKNT